MAYTITPLTPHNTGAEIRGLDLTKPVDPETRAALNRAFAQYHVLVVRDQKYEPADFIRAVQIWGELQPHDKKDHHIPGFPEMYYVTNEEFLGDRSASSPAKRFTPTTRTIRRRRRRRSFIRWHCRAAAAIRNMSTCTSPMTSFRRR